MVNFLKTNNSITLHYDGKTKLVAKDDPNFDKVIAAIRANKLDTIPAIVEPERYFEDQGLEVEDGLLKVDGDIMPTELNSRIMEYQRDGLPFQSLLNFWANLKQNPSFNSRKALFSFLENQGHSITTDGCFIGYRGVRDDFKDKHTGKFDNTPGKTVKVLRSEVDDNPANSCSFGLHVGGFNYAKSFGPKLVMVKVNPKNVVAVPDAYKGDKMRVCEFEVLCETSDPSKATAVEVKEGGKLTAVAPLTAAEKRAHKRRYANNHAKRGPNGTFIANKKAKKGKKKSGRKSYNYKSLRRG